jgi:hypothetical protein
LARLSPLGSWFLGFVALHGLLAVAYKLVILLGGVGLRTWWTSWFLTGGVTVLYFFCIHGVSRRRTPNQAWAIPLPLLHLLLNLMAVLVARWLGVLETKADALVFVALILLDLAFVNRALVSILRPH